MSRRILYEAPRVAAAPGERVVTSTCGHNCGGRCVVNAHVRDERIVKISTDPRTWTPEMPPLHACVRGFGQMERVNHPDRLRHPLRRKGPRGAGEFERIAWDEALDEVARQMRRVRDTYGPAAILDCSRTGSLSMRHGARIVCVDPRVTRTSRELADEHVFIRPSTDAAALIAMAYVIVTEGRHDQAFLDRHVLGFDEAHLPPGAPEGASYRSYLLGLADGVRKTPEWAAAITGMPAGTIRRLAIEYATTKPAALQCGYAPGRTINGEQFHRAAYALAAITGSVGTPGGNSGVSNGATGRGGIKSLPPGPNPAGARVATPLLADVLERGRAGGYPADIKMVYSVGGDLFNQAPNVHKTAAAAQRLEFMVVHDHFITPTARYADIVLPATTFWERNDVHTPWAGAGHYVIFMKQAIAPVDECRNDFDICADIARRLGIEDYSDKNEEGWLRELTRDTIDDFDTFRAQGLARLPALDPRQPADPHAGRSRRRLDQSRRRRRARHRGRRDGARVQRARHHHAPRVRDRPRRSRCRLHQGGRLVHPRCARRGHARLRQRADRRPRLARRRRHLQHLLRGDRAGLGAAGYRGASRLRRGAPSVWG